jgi:cytochrome c553
MRWRFMRVFCFVLAVLLSSAEARAQKAAPPVAAILFQNVCATCHGAKGEGNPAFQAPAIAGLPDWYVRGQLEAFRAGRRGAHAQDMPGQLMRAMSMVLDDKKSANVAAFVATLPRANPRATLHADPTAGARLYAERCAECHRYNGAGELVFGAAPLAGLPDWYLAAQLRKFKNGQRGGAPHDVNGQKMVLAASYLEGEDVIRSMAVYLFSLGNPPKERGKPKEEGQPALPFK